MLSWLFVSSFSYLCPLETGQMQKMIGVLILAVRIIKVSLRCFPSVSEGIGIKLDLTCMGVHILFLPRKNEEVIIHDLFTVDAAFQGDFTVDLPHPVVNFYCYIGTRLCPCASLITHFGLKRIENRMISITGFHLSNNSAGARKESVRVFFQVMAARISTIPVTITSRNRIPFSVYSKMPPAASLRKAICGIPICAKRLFM